MKVSIILILTLFFFNLSINGQSRTITGRVISEDFETMPGVSITINDTVEVGRTDLNGFFQIDIPVSEKKLLFGTVGLESTSIELLNKCDTVEVVMMYDGTYDFMTLRKVDRLRKKRFDNLTNLHSEAVRNGLFKNNNICYERLFKADKPTNPVLDSLSKAYKSKRKQIKDTFNGLALGDTIRIPYSGSWREDGTDRTTLHLYSNGVDGEDFDCIIRVVITDKNKRKGGYNLVCRVIDCNDCHYDNIVRNGKELKVGETIEFNMKYYKILKNK